MKKRTFTAEFKFKIVVEILKGEKDINVGLIEQVPTTSQKAPQEMKYRVSVFV